MKQEITYCKNCGDGWSDEDFMFGTCCGARLRTRLETDEEEKSRREAVNRITERASKQNW